MARAARKTPRSRERELALEAAASVRVPRRCDVCVVGGGASGVATAVAAAEAGALTVALEREASCARRLLATGNGRCNLSNARLGRGRYRNPGFVGAVAGERFGEGVLAFFRESGLAVAEEGEGRLYPWSRQARSVRDVLLARAARSGAVLAPAREVREVARDPSGAWRVVWDDRFGEGAGSLLAASVVLAAGGGEKVLCGLGLGLEPFRPVLCSLACEPLEPGLDLAALDGRRCRARLVLLRGGRTVLEERGEVLFRPYGVSGIAAFNLSRAAEAGDVLALDLLDGLGADEARRLSARAGSAAGVLDPEVERVLAGVAQDVAGLACDLRLLVRGAAEPERAQVTRGGLRVEGFRPETLEARELPGLFACGEALDVDADCGGFNLAWAWKSGLVAGASAARRARAEGA